MADLSSGFTECGQCYCMCNRKLTGAFKTCSCHYFKGTAIIQSFYNRVPMPVCFYLARKISACSSFHSHKTIYVQCMIRTACFPDSHTTISVEEETLVVISIRSGRRLEAQ